jgi:hypothetical protein
MSVAMQSAAIRKCVQSVEGSHMWWIDRRIAASKKSHPAELRMAFIFS